MAVAPLTDREVLPYLVIVVSLMSAVWFIPGWTRNVWDHMSTGISVLLSILGTIWLFQRNGGATSQHFLQRYLAIGWVVAVRWTTAILLLLVLSYSVLYSLDVVAETTTWHEVVFFALAEAVLYWRMGVHIHDLAARTATV
jgi:hypothetical protein